MPLHSLRGRCVLFNRLSSLVERCISWKISLIFNLNSHSNPWCSRPFKGLCNLRPPTLMIRGRPFDFWGEAWVIYSEKIFFPKPVEIEYISLAYNGVRYFSPALHATRDFFFSVLDIFFWNHLHTRGWVASHADVRMGIRKECLTNVTNPLNIPLTSLTSISLTTVCQTLLTLNPLFPLISVPKFRPCPSTSLVACSLVLSKS